MTLRFTLGCMRLSGAGVEEARAIAVIHAALDAGFRALDTADVYAPDDGSLHHNERLVRRALDTWTGDRATVEVATKGGLRRPGGPWIPDGRAKHLRAACAESAEILGEPIDLYYLHVPDPRRPFATSVRALASLVRDGLVRRVGLSNVNAAQLEEASRIVDLAAVQVELSRMHDDPLRNGVLDWCIAHDVALTAHTPLGGKKRGRLEDDAALTKVASRHGATVFEVALAWLLDLDPHVVPVVGATRPETIASCVRAHALALDDEDRALLSPTAPTARETTGDVVVIMGMPGAGKTTHAQKLAGEGYARLNRDELGGRVDALVPRLRDLLDRGERRVVLDNTYPTRASRHRVIEAAAELGAPTRCLFVDTPLGEAQINAVLRILDRYGHLPHPGELRRASRRDPNAFGPQAQHRWIRELEPPSTDEGFARVDRISFERTWPETFSRPAIFIEHEGILRASKSGAPQPLSRDDLEVHTDRADALRRASDEALLLGISWQPGVSGGDLDHETARALLDETHARLGVEIPVAYCPHPAGPPICWCRKPLPGLVLLLAREHGVDPAQSTLVGKSPADRTLAERLGMRYLEHTEFWTTPARRLAGR